MEISSVQLRDTTLDSKMDSQEAWISILHWVSAAVSQKSQTNTSWIYTAGRLPRTSLLRIPYNLSFS